ncbi:type I-E CRISPR-associated protein Cse1/CasA [Marinospirillum alkaliphilum]|uniref:CRISPR-associated protein, Cse1 family n=1 Tax=Marinospirillum alkaliphilum DSM 21637 TaxID=1122209 RepID=A0A1K1W9W9_9GAMM|nr:type I-E CRISPR-associated protein Cse1/CasA [Marinospirillum alkaliphilum]SFX34184.1 CRISPR-associated protein, Cse1 family [Marinospirillum alkaliphilum DSM 21637]
MNLLKDPWLTWRLSDGREERRPMTALVDPDVVDFALPRSDFHGAAWQFAIGLLQTLMAPADEDEWFDQHESPPDQEDFAAILERAAHAFNLDGDGPLFMQDFDALAEVDPTPISGLLIEAPGGNTIKNNTDLFIKRGVGSALSPEMAALALFTLQINAPSGGQGHRTSLRGGGPLTTLVLPHEENTCLWRKLWLNVINRECWEYDEPDLHSVRVFPWLGLTRVSKNKGTEVYLHDVHPLTHFWAMPRRIRLDFEDRQGMCQLSGLEAERLVTHYRTSNYGNNYSGSWYHPLTHYRSNPKKPDEDFLSTKGQPGGVQYRQWHSLCFLNDQEGNHPALVIRHYLEDLQVMQQNWGKTPRLWAFGYDMDNMKARAWYSSEFPLYRVDPEKRDDQISILRDLQKLSEEALWHTRTQIKNAWHDKPSDVKGDFSFIDLQFWQVTEPAFFRAVEAVLNDADTWLSTEAASVWLKVLTEESLQLFDKQVLGNLHPDRDMKRKIKARRMLAGWLFGGKEIKKFKTTYMNGKEDAA